MELLLILTYTAICVAIFKIFQIPVNKWTLPTAALGGILLIGFILLTIGLLLSPALMYQKYGVYFKADPKIIWAILVWAFYLALLVLRWRFHQGGRRFAWGAVGSFAFVLLTFWGFNLLSPVHNP